MILLAQALTLAVSGPSTSIAYLPIRVAQADGYFTREGLAVTVRPMSNPVQAAEALLEGNADLAATTLETIARRATGPSGSQVRLAFGLTAAPAAALLGSVGQPDSPRSVADLARRTIAIGAPGPDETWLGAVLARASLDARTTRIVSKGERNLVRALETGEVAGALIPEPSVRQMLAAGRATLLADLRTPRAAAEALNAQTVDAAVFARADRLPSPATLAAVARALLAAEQRIATGDPAELAPRLPGGITARTEEFADRAAAAGEAYLPKGEVSVERVRAMLEVTRRRIALPLIERLPRPSELVIAPAR